MKRWVLALVAIFVVMAIVQRRSGEEPSNPANGDRPSSEPAAPAGPPIEPAVLARQLVTTLSQVDVRPETLTPATAEAWLKDLATLQDQGTAAVPAIGEFLEKNTDVRFDQGPRANVLGVPTLRMAFMKVLFDIPAPDNVNLQVKVLQVTNDPDEVVLLARQLDQQEPGQYREVVIDAARRSLESVRQGRFPGRDTKALTKLLRQYEKGTGK